MKAKVNVVSTVDSAAPDTLAAVVVSPPSAGAAGPVAALNSVQQVQLGTLSTLKLSVKGTQMPIMTVVVIGQ